MAKGFQSVYDHETLGMLLTSFWLQLFRTCHEQLGSCLFLDADRHSTAKQATGEFSRALALSS